MISQLSRLEHLDDSVVTNEERESATKIYGRRRLSTLSTPGKNPSQVRMCSVKWYNGFLEVNWGFQRSPTPKLSFPSLPLAYVTLPPGKLEMSSSSSWTSENTYI